MTITHQLDDRQRLCGRSILHESLSDSDLADLRDVLDSAQHLLSWEAMPAFEDVHDFQAASEALTQGWTVIDAALHGDGRIGEIVAGTDDMGALMSRINRSERRVRAAETRHRDDSLRTARTALARFQDITTVGRLMEEGAEAVCSLGFDRAIISRIDDSTWVTETLHVDGDSAWALEILEAGRQHPQPLAPGLPEQELIRRQRAILVTGVQQKVQRDGQVHTAIAESSLSRSYVAAPLMPRSKVIGFVHGDKYFHRSDVTAFDRDLLSLFSEGYGFALERTMLIEQLDQIRSEIQLFASGIGSVSPALSLARSVAAEQEPPQRLTPARDDDSRLTRREMEVLRLMAEGDTNVRIAHRLIISEGTVKSHVKHILRKLGAANRAEAVAKWHRSTHGRM